MSFLNIEHVGKDFPNREGGRLPVCVLDDVSLNIERGEFLTVVGHSGCGKSTLLNILAGFEKATRGKVVLDGNPVAGPGLDRMVVFQNFALLPWMSAFENVRISVQAAFPNWERTKIRVHTEKYFHLMGLASAENKRPAHLSGGMRQRVGLARGLVIEPEVLLMDEPFSKLDQLTARRLREESLQICARLKQTTMLVTHDVEEAAYMGDRIVILCARPARIVEIFDNPLAPGQRDVDDPAFIQFKKQLLNTVLKLMEKDEVLS